MFDVIGDIHGHYDALDALLRRLGYRHRDGAWRHAGRQAVFVGDLIDRGPKQLETLDAVRRMVDAGSARCILGNHEFNAVAWHMPDPTSPGTYLRSHGNRNRAQHQALLDQVGEGSALHREIIGWFKTLPLWIDEGEVRFVHACWHAPSLEWLETQVEPDASMSDRLYIQGARKGNPAFTAIEAVCKGPEAHLPPGVSFRDHEGRARRKTRIKWWEPELLTYQQAMVGSPEVTWSVPEDLAFPPSLVPAPYHGPPVFFGHYWFEGMPRILADNLACVDYSVARDGPLVAYRWDGEALLSSDRFVQSG